MATVHLNDTTLRDFNTNMDQVGGRLGGTESKPRRNGGDTSMTLDLESGGDRLYAMVPRLTDSMALDASGAFVTVEERVSRGRSNRSLSGRR